MKFRKFGKGAIKAVNEEELALWVPVTNIGKKVYKGEIEDIDIILTQGKPILEYQIVDKLLPDMESEVLELRSTQRVTDNGRKASYRAVVIGGDRKNYIGIGIGKHAEVKPSIIRATKRAKRNIIKVTLGSGSWEDSKEHVNSIPITVTGKCCSVKVTIKPAPRGVGIVANKIIRKVLSYGGIKDAWTKAMGKTNNTHNLTLATIDALKNLNRQTKNITKIKDKEKNKENN